MTLGDERPPDYNINNSNNTIADALRSARVDVQLEPPGLTNDSAIRPDGRTMIPWKGGRYLAWDATVSCTLAPSYRARSALKAGSSASGAEDRKIRKYSGLQESFVFQPIAFETLGVVGERTQEFLKDLAARVVQETAQPRAGEYLLQRLGIEIQRGNATAVTSTLPHKRGLPGIG